MTNLDPAPSGPRKDPVPFIPPTSPDSSQDIDLASASFPAGLPLIPPQQPKKGVPQLPVPPQSQASVPSLKPAYRTEEEQRNIAVFNSVKDSIAYIVNLTSKPKEDEFGLIKKEDKSVTQPSTPPSTTTPPSNTPATPPAAAGQTDETAEEAAKKEPANVPGLLRPNGLGSGVIVDLDYANGVILTNIHVIDGAEKIVVKLADNKVYEAEILGSVKELDLAVLKLKNPPPNLKTVPFGDSSTLEVGQKVFAVGNPFGLYRTLTTGIISAIRNEVKHPDGFVIPGLIQTDASINPGNSGGALVDGEGRLIGINTFIISPNGGGSVGIGFAVPMDGVTINNIKQVLPQIVKFGWILEDTDRGPMVKKVFAGGPADQAGIMPIDRPEKKGQDPDSAYLIERVNGTQVNNIQEAQQLLSDALNKPGMKLNLTFRIGRKDGNKVERTFPEAN